jgi:hypothetical protein
VRHFPPPSLTVPSLLATARSVRKFEKNFGISDGTRLPFAFLDYTCSPVLLTPEAFQAFLPAYLFRALDDLSKYRTVLEFTVYSLTPGESNGRSLEERSRLMNPEQIKAIRAFLQYIQENAEDAKWFRPSITGALENVWR